MRRIEIEPLAYDLMRSDMDSKPVIITIRYSVLQKGSRSWIISRKNDESDYKNLLFSPDRLRIHYELFSRLCIPSLAALELNSKKHRVVVFVSTELPSYALAQLEELVSLHAWLQLQAVSPSKRIPHRTAIREFIRDLDINGPYAHVRLDDDDALLPCFVSRLSQYIRFGSTGHAVSFPRGFNLCLDPERKCFTAAYEVDYPMNAQGLAVIGDARTEPLLDIYALGKHTEIDRKIPVILDCDEPAYVRTIHPASDTGGQGRMSGRPVALSELALLLPTLPRSIRAPS